MCLYFLDLLQYEHFRREIVNSQCVKFIDDQAVLLWQHYTRRRMKLLSLHNGTVQNGHQQQNGSPSSSPKPYARESPRPSCSNAGSSSSVAANSSGPDSIGTVITHR